MNRVLLIVLFFSTATAKDFDERFTGKTLCFDYFHSGISTEKYFGKVGAFEGGMYRAKGLYRPEVDCIMFTRNPNYFCKVCSAGILRVINLYTE